MKVLLKNARLAFPNLFKAVQFDGQGCFRFGANFLVEPGSDNDKAIKKAIEAAAKETWAAKAPKTLAAIVGNANKYCYLDGNNKDYDGYEDRMYLSAHRKQEQGAPAVVGLGGKGDNLTAESGKPYAGCYVNASVDIWAQDGQYPGIRCSLVGVQFVADGDAFAGSPANAEDFDAIEGGADADDFGA